jgi:hypothetical protein
MHTVTLQPPSYSDLSSPVTAIGSPGGTPARQLTEPLRELCAFALLAGNAVFLLLGISRLFIVIDGWASQFGQRCVLVYPTFVGLVSLALPMGALLLATHLAPMIPRSKLVVLGVAIEYGVSALFGVITFLGAFAHGLSSARETLEGTLERGVWLAFLVLACVIALRLQLRLYPPTPRRPAYADAYLPTTYGKPYPGQPLYPQSYPTRTNGSAATVVASGAVPPTDPFDDAATSGSGWPAVPPPPMPTLLLDADPTTRIELPVPAESGGEATQIMRAPEEVSEAAE